MGTATAPETAAPVVAASRDPNSLTVAAPEGARWSFEEVKAERGAKSLGEVPLLVWESLDAARATYGDEGLVNILDGTSLRVSFQSIARRGVIQNKTFDEIAKAQVEFRPGKRAVGQSTPVSRAASAARKVAEKVGGDQTAALLERIGTLSPDDLAALMASLG